MLRWTVHLEGGPRRVNHAAVAVGHRVYSFGGYCSGEDYETLRQIDVHIFNAVSLRWTKLPPVRPAARGQAPVVPYMRYGHSTVLIDDTVFLWGGRNDTEGACNVLYAFDVNTHKWSTPRVSGTVPGARDGHSACVLGKTMYIFGGYEQLADCFSNDIHKLDTSTMGQLRGASRRQVTYVRSGRRAPAGGSRSGTPEPGCCALRGRPRLKGPRWQIDLQPWAGPARSLDEEALRFLRYISTIQIECDHMSTDSLATDSSPTKKPWPVCLDDRFGLVHQIRNKQCRLYSLGLGSDDTHFEVGMASNGCEVHRFDPSVKSAHVLESERLWFHRLSIDWRDPHPAVAAQKPYGNTRKLGAILNEFGHHKIDVLKADLESAEWKVLENLILEDVLEQIGQLIFEIHLHWPGFEGPPLIEGPQLCSLQCLLGFPDGSAVKKPPTACNAGDVVSNPGSGRSGEGNGNAHQCSCLGNPMDRGAWRVTIHWVSRAGHD